MQVKKNDIKAKIMSSACEEFLEHGFSKASLRVIADNAELSKGAIYSYFKNKDDLFCQLVSPAFEFLKNEFEHGEPFNREYAEFSKPSDEAVKSFSRCANIVLSNVKIFKLLFFSSAGSSVEDYKEIIIQIYAKNFNNVLSFFTNANPCKTSLINEMFVHTLATTFVSFLQELVIHEPNRIEIEEYVTQLAIFVHNGINSLYLHQIKK